MAEIVVANRDAARVGRLAARSGGAGALRAGIAREATLRARAAARALLVNATSLGWHAGETPSIWRPDHLCRRRGGGGFDLPRDGSPAGRGGAGLPVVDGLPMLVHQGARAFTLWTGYEAPVATMLAAAQQAQATS